MGKLIEQQQKEIFFLNLSCLLSFTEPEGDLLGNIPTHFS